MLGVAPGYEEKHFSADDKRGRLRLVASPNGALGSVTLQQDAKIYAGLLDGAESASLALADGRRAYAHVARGVLQVNCHALAAGDAAKLIGEPSLVLSAGRDAEVLVIDLP